MTAPGQSTPWAKLPIPSEGKTPDVPVDLAGLADPLDTLLKNVIGGSAAPTGPLSPNLIDTSASIGSLNSTQSTQQGQIKTLQDQVAGLSVAPWAAASSRDTNFTVAPGTTNYLCHSMAVPSTSVKSLLLCGVAGNMRWQDRQTEAVMMGALQLKWDSDSAYSDRARSLQSGVYQTLSCWHIETLPAGVGCRIGMAISIVGAASGTVAENAYMWPHIYAIRLPWGNGPDVPIVSAPY